MDVGVGTMTPEAEAEVQDDVAQQGPTQVVREYVLRCGAAEPSSVS